MHVLRGVLRSPSRRRVVRRRVRSSGVARVVLAVGRGAESRRACVASTIVVVAARVADFAEELGHAARAEQLCGLAPCRRSQSMMIVVVAGVADDAEELATATRLRQAPAWPEAQPESPRTSRRWFPKTTRGGNAISNWRWTSARVRAAFDLQQTKANKRRSLQKT